jgi:hypothetical protein
MGACYEIYTHEFVSCWVQPTANKCTFIKEALKALNTEEIDPWIEAYAVHHGVVYWQGWGSQARAKRDAKKLHHDYGVDELPLLGDVRTAPSGYLIRYVSQGKVASYGPGELKKDEVFPEVVSARGESLDDYFTLVNWLVHRGARM